MNRPEYRAAQDRQPYERRTVETAPSGDKFDVTWRQVGWIGGTGRMYALHENPAPTEPGSFAPLWREIWCERIEPREASVVLLDEIEGTGV